VKQQKQSVRYRTTDKMSDAHPFNKAGSLTSVKGLSLAALKAKSQRKRLANQQIHRGVIVRLNRDAGFGYVKEIASNRQYIFTLGGFVLSSGDKLKSVLPISPNVAVEFLTDDQSRVTKMMLEKKIKE
jgi:hypothetical protein